jgi:hypothetical protein
MTAPTFTTLPTLQELRDSHTIYLKALQLLAQDGSKIEDVRETVCWKRLMRLHQAMPGLFLSPETLFLRLTPVKTSARTRRRT